MSSSLSDNRHLNIFSTVASWLTCELHMLYLNPCKNLMNVGILMFYDLNWRLWCLISLIGFLDMDPQQLSDNGHLNILSTVASRLTCDALFKPVSKLNER